MQFETSFPIIVNGYRCKEVPVKDDLSYSKLITSDGRVAVLVSEGYGSDWSVSIKDAKLKKKMIVDSRLVRYVSSEEFKKEYSHNRNLSKIQSHEFIKLLRTLIPEFGHDVNIFGNKIHEFAQLTIKFIPLGCAFRIEEYDGNESVKVFNPNDYISV
jgi:hypothetical protein